MSEIKQQPEQPEQPLDPAYLTPYERRMLVWAITAIIPGSETDAALLSALAKLRGDHPASHVLCDRIAELESELAELRAERDRYHAALVKINDMGAVCVDFMECTHASCRDSCGAKLTALTVLEGDNDDAVVDQTLYAHRLTRSTPLLPTVPSVGAVDRSTSSGRPS